MTRFPSTSLNFTHIRNISPQSSLPTVPTASAPSNSPRFFGCLIASSILSLKSSVGFIRLSQMVSGQIRINFYAPGVDATRHGPDIFKAVTGEIRSRIETTDSVMANKNDLPIFWPLGHYLLHQLLRKKCGTLDVNGIPFFPAPDIDQREWVARTQPFSHFSGRDLRFLIRILGGKNGSDNLVHRKIAVALANRGKSFPRANPATRTPADVVGPEN